MRLSVIVPVYNTEAYLARCVESLLQLHVGDYEIVLVDDGSTDHSGDICDEYALKYSIIKTFHKKNGGIISARKHGIKNASGRYIAFVDSDDWVGENIFTEHVYAMEENEELDVCIGGLKKIFPDGTESFICQVYSSSIMTNIEAMKEMLQWNKFRWELCGNLYRRTLFQVFDPSEEVSVGEDLISNFWLLRNARKILYQPIYQYYYFTNMESVTELGIEKFQSLIKPFYHISKMKIQDRDLNILIREFYIKEIIKDIWYRLFLGDGFDEKITFYRSEINMLMSLESVYSFIEKHFDMINFRKSLEDDCQFVLFWRSLSESIVNVLRSNLSCYRHIYIYGTGMISKFITKILRKNNIKYDLYVVSDGQRKIAKNIKYLSEITDENQYTVFILALGVGYHDMVTNNMHEKGYTNILIIDSISSMYR